MQIEKSSINFSDTVLALQILKTVKECLLIGSLLQQISDGALTLAFLFDGWAVVMLVMSHLIHFRIGNGYGTLIVIVHMLDWLKSHTSRTSLLTSLIVIHHLNVVEFI